MKEVKPTCDPNGVYSVKRTCAELGISHKTLHKYRDNGYIQPLNPQNVYRPKYSGQSIGYAPRVKIWENVYRPKYSGQSIIDCWNLMKTI